METLHIPAGPDLVLKTWENDSASALFSLTDRNREYLEKWLPWLPFVKIKADSQSFIQTAQESWEKKASLELGIWRREVLLGCIGLHELNRLHNRTSIGYWLGAEFQGKGVMTTATSALIKYCFEDLEFNRVEIRAAVENSASRAIPERLGFQQEGVLRQAELVNGTYLDVAIYSQIKKDWDLLRSQPSRYSTQNS